MFFFLIRHIKIDETPVGTVCLSNNRYPHISPQILFSFSLLSLLLFLVNFLSYHRRQRVPVSFIKFVTAEHTQRCFYTNVKILFFIFVVSAHTSSIFSLIIGNRKLQFLFVDSKYQAVFFLLCSF
jgi:hypothetical protein